MGPQQHDPGCPGGDPYPDKLIPHYNVVRKIVLGSDGEGLISGSWAKNNSISKTYSFKLDSASWVAENCNIIIYVDKKGDTLCHSEIQQAVVQSVTRPVGIIESQQNQVQVLSVFPNPSQGIMTIQVQLNKEGTGRLSLFDVFGREVKIISEGFMGNGLLSFQFNSREVASGIYSVLLRTGKEKISHKIVIL